MPPPLVSVGIPAYNRPESLERAVRSVLDQTHSDLEVVISDDASTDAEVARVGERLGAEDTRVSYMRQPRNIGHDRNYQRVLELAQGSYFMWLSDDDRLHPRYVERCLAALQADPGLVIAWGTARYYRDGEHVIDERPMDLGARRPGLRVVSYFARVSVNGPLFGLMRRSELIATGGFPEVPGGDWLLVARMAARGRVLTLRDVHLHRSLAGLGTRKEELAQSFGLTGGWARHHHLWVARHLLGALPVSRAAAALSSLLVVLRFPGIALLRRAGLGWLEPRISGWLRARDLRGSRP
jgi:glycosyltransferase involved in cell wall biosynthesis